MKPAWVVVRQDANGKETVIAEVETEDEAHAIAKSQETRGPLYVVMTRAQLEAARRARR
ncbi:MAG: hypothetical protein HOV81_30740 [Kofleriaceae bacterium]|nr:hypothetical protein [Kofleriaceae bacterium]